MADVTNDMIDAAMDARKRQYDMDWPFDVSQRSNMRAALAAGLAAAPTVDGWVWCDTKDGVCTLRDGTCFLGYDDTVMEVDCRGPHRTLIVGTRPTDPDPCPDCGGSAVTDQNEADDE